MSRQFRSWYVVLIGPGNRYQGWIVTSDSKRDAEKHARRQVEEVWRGRWYVRSIRRATSGEVAQVGSFSR